MTTAIWWIRRDLRLADNQALSAALARADDVLPVFVLDPGLLASPYAGDKRLAFLLEGLRRLEAYLQGRGSRLIFRRGEPRQVLARLMREAGASAIFAEEDYSPYARRRDARVAEALPLALVGGLTVHPPGAVSKANGEPYTVFTPYSRAWKALPRPSARAVLPAPDRIPTPPAPAGEPIPAAPGLPAAVPFPAGEAEARRRLAAFIDGDRPPIYRYGDARNRVDLAGTSSLSPYLRFGMLSARQAVVSALAAIEEAPTAGAWEGAETWLNELIWREFYVAILYHFPQVRRHSFRRELRAIPWARDEAAWRAWTEGRTGYPVVDAAMRQLQETGWMHNRARMIVASFLVKDLLLDWRRGERWFMRHLVDGDPAANNGGWQWTAGTGTDAAPYFRIFNPVLQGQKSDPHGAYVRRWLPELARVPNQYIHQPWAMPAAAQEQAGCVIGQDYPAPIVDHGWARERTLEVFGRVRQKA